MISIPAPKIMNSLPPAELENLVLRIRRSAVTHPLSERDWKRVDRMRRRLAVLKKGDAR